MIRLLFFLMLTIPATGSTAELIADPCNPVDIENKIAQAADGDTVILSATVTASEPTKKCQWSRGISIQREANAPASIHIRGAGMDRTIIETADVAFSINAVEGKSWSLSGMTIVPKHTGAANITVFGSSKSWRIHSIKFVQGNGNPAPVFSIAIRGHTYGVIDRCEFTGDRANAISIDADDWDSWKRPQEWGSAAAVYIEDNLFRVLPYNTAVAQGATDCERGGRFVFRYNTTYNQIAQGHGFDSGQIASCMSMEVYGNRGFIKTESSLAWTWLGQIRGGATIWYDNTWEVDPYSTEIVNGIRLERGVWLGNSIALRIYRADGSPHGWGDCDGTQQKLCSNVDRHWKLLANSWWPYSCKSDADCTSEKHRGTSNAVCQWKFCSKNKMALCNPANGDLDCKADGNDWGSCTEYLDGPVDGAPCFMQPGRSTNNLLKPAYEWNNSCVGAQGNCVGGLGAGNVHFAVSSYQKQVTQLTENVDYYNFKPSFDGSGGTGRGLLSQRPSNCTPGVVFWATDQKRLYHCSASNQWQEYYTPYVYPHPLTNGGQGGGTPARPENFNIKSE